MLALAAGIQISSREVRAAIQPKQNKEKTLTKEFTEKAWYDQGSGTSVGLQCVCQYVCQMCLCVSSVCLCV